MGGLVAFVLRQKLYMALAALALFATFMALITFEYWDLDSMTAWTMNFWDLLFKGRLDEFYEYTALKLHGAKHYNCEGNYLWLLPWCLWNLPMWAVSFLRGGEEVAFWSLCWSKSFLLLMELVTIWFCVKISALLISDAQKKLLLVLLMLASPEIMMSVGYSGQDEMTYVCFFSIALYCFLKRRRGWAYFWMVCAVSCCPLMLMPALALFLMEEKNPGRLLLKIAGLLTPLFLFEMAYRNDLTYQTAKAANDFAKMAEEMLSASTIHTAMGEISIAAFLLAIVYFGCYRMNIIEETAEWERIVLYVTAVIFVVISFLMSNGFYRLFLYVPFLLLLLLTSEQDLQVNMLLLVVLTYGRTLFACYRNEPDNMNTYCVMKNSWITALCDRLGSTKYYAENASCLYDYLKGRSITPGLMALAMSCVMASVALLLFLNRPWCKEAIRVQGGVKTSFSVVAYSLCTPALLLLFYVSLFR